MNIKSELSCPKSFVNNLICGKAYQFCQNHELKDVEQSDVEQELILEVLKKCNQYDPTRSEIQTFLDRVIDNKCTSILRYYCAEKRTAARESFSLNVQVKDFDGKYVDRSATLDACLSTAHLFQRKPPQDELHEMKVDVEAILEILNSQLQILAESLKSKSPYAIAMECNISRRQIANQLAAMRKTFEAAFLKNIFKK
ncbi:hypothetical protein [uncultured Rubinisphaera sp.]|uniref:hypothetical protein n=1 Tax=uncultured Rubinisphaera sp. TaxID=1678686 RepID=UPI0030DA7352